MTRGLRGMNLSADELWARVRAARGPGPGEGRGPGRPWRGIVEETTCIWVQWVVNACKRLGRTVPDSLGADGAPVLIVPVHLTYGVRYYFLCPQCARKVEALYFLPGEFGCRKCLRLGYRSQARRSGSIYRYLDLTFDRRSLLSQRYEDVDNPIVADVVKPLRKMMAKRIEAMLSRVTVADEDPPIDEPEGEQTSPTPPAYDGRSTGCQGRDQRERPGGVEEP